MQESGVQVEVAGGGGSVRLQSAQQLDAIDGVEGVAVNQALRE